MKDALQQMRADRAGYRAELAKYSKELETYAHSLH